jgi:predicted transposase YdaD
MCDTGRITEDETRKLAELSRIILNYITVDLDNEIRERMVSVVGGQVLELQEDRWLKEGMEKGIEKGKITARFEDGMPVEKIAERTSVSIEVVKAVLRDAGMIKE